MRKFIIKVLFYFIPFLCICGGYKIQAKYYTSGDLGRLGKISFGKSYNEKLELNYLTENLVENTTIENFQPSKTLKIVTIGDSFSRQGIFGYQNYLAHTLNDSIINILEYEQKFESAISFLENENVDGSNCQILIVERVDRLLVPNLCNIDFEPLCELPQNESTKSINKDSALYTLTSWIRLLFGYDNPVLKYDLKQNCFTHSRFSHKLFFYIYDFDFKKTKSTDIEKAKEKLILLNKKASEKGIKMIFLIAADKYDVYRPFMTDDSLPIDTTTDELSNIPGVCIINTKYLLQDMVRNGEKDVYMVNDTHWSYKASEAVAKKLAENIDSLGKRVTPPQLP